MALKAVALQETSSTAYPSHWRNLTLHSMGSLSQSVWAGMFGNFSLDKIIFLTMYLPWVRGQVRSWQFFLCFANSIKSLSAKQGTASGNFKHFKVNNVFNNGFIFVILQIILKNYVGDLNLSYFSFQKLAIHSSNVVVQAWENVVQ